MRIRTFSPMTRMARPINTERDYRVVKTLVAQRARTFFFAETERLEALIRELTDFESRAAHTETGVTAECAEWAPVQRRNELDERNRRWCDTIDPCVHNDSTGECFAPDGI
jgi:hypothetical protein